MSKKSIYSWPMCHNVIQYPLVTTHFCLYVSEAFPKEDLRSSGIFGLSKVSVIEELKERRYVAICCAESV